MRNYPGTLLVLVLAATTLPARAAGLDDPRETVRAADHGIACDGRTDESANIDALLVRHAGKRIVLPAGTCLYAGSMALPSDTVLAGAGKGLTTLKLAPGAPASTKVVRNSDRSAGNGRITIADMTIDCNRAANGRAPGITAIDWRGVTHSVVRNVRFTGCTQHAIDASESNSDNLFTGNDCDDYGTGAIGFCIVVLSDAHRNRIAGNHAVTTNPNVCFAVDDASGGTGGVPSSGNEIIANTCDGAAIGIMVVGSHRNRVEKNRVLYPTDKGIQISPSTDVYNDAIDNVVTGNTIDIAQSVNAFGILASGRGTIVSGNTVSRGQHCIYVQDSAGAALATFDTLVADNTCTGSSQDGILLAGGSRTTVRGNTIRFPGLSAIAVQPVASVADLREIDIIANVVSGVGDKGIRIDPAGTAVRGVRAAQNVLIDASGRARPISP